MIVVARQILIHPHLQHGPCRNRQRRRRRRRGSRPRVRRIRRSTIASRRTIVIAPISIISIWTSIRIRRSRSAILIAFRPHILVRIILIRIRCMRRCSRTRRWIVLRIRRLVRILRRILRPVRGLRWRTGCRRILCLVLCARRSGRRRTLVALLALLLRRIWL